MTPPILPDTPAAIAAGMDGALRAAAGSRQIALLPPPRVPNHAARLTFGAGGRDSVWFAGGFDAAFALLRRAIAHVRPSAAEAGGTR
jgi:hypothetical protein